MDINLLNDELKNQIKDLSLNNILEEICGLVIKKDQNLSIFPCQNISYDKSNHCILNPLDYIKASKQGKIVAHFHSQKEKSPSLLDNITAFNHNIYSIIYSSEYDIFSVIEPKLDDYLNKEYITGESDCYTLLQNYFKKELNITLKDYDRQENWWKSRPNLILDKFKETGGIPVSFGDIKKNDILVFNIGGVPCHFAIYMGNDFILHHPFKEKSVLNELSQSLKKRMVLVIRHKDLF